MKIYKILKQFLSLLLLLFFIAYSDDCEAKIYFVSVDGENNSTGDFDRPFKTIQKGANMLDVGDTLIVKSGIYRENQIKIKKSGYAKKPIIIKAEKSGTVFLYGTREKERVDGGGVGFFIDKSYINIDGFHFENYGTGVYIESATEVIVKNSTFKNSGESGIIVANSISPNIKFCRFIGKTPINKVNIAIQDYAISLYFTEGAVVENNYIYGAHNQSISFKEDCHNGIVRRNIIEGVLYTGIYLGQNRRVDGRKKSTNLTTEYNIIRATNGYRVKSPIRIDNVEDASVHHNYIEGFDETDNTGGIHIFSEALGSIKIYNNIIAFAIKNKNSAGVAKENNISIDTIIKIKNNILYNVSKDFFGTLNPNGSYFKNNISQSYSNNYYTGVGSTNNQQGNLKFKRGVPKQKAISSAPKKYDFQTYYNELVNNLAF
jgi:hypothetical protein